jgi:hypothetical protein
MEIKFIIISLLIIIILVLLFLNCKFKESFQDNSQIDFNDKFSSQKLIDMFDSLENAEQRCKKIENDLEIQQDIDNMKERETEYKELDELDKKILELKEILKELTIEKTRKDNINNECKKDTQVKLNKNYDILNKLNDKNLIPSENMAVDLNVSDLFLNKKNISNFNKNESKCQTKDTKDYVTATNVKNKCHNCNIESIKKNLQHLDSDFKQ